MRSRSRQPYFGTIYGAITNSSFVSAGAMSSKIGTHDRSESLRKHNWKGSAKTELLGSRSLACSGCDHLQNTRARPTPSGVPSRFDESESRRTPRKSQDALSNRGQRATGDVRKRMPKAVRFSEPPGCRTNRWPPLQPKRDDANSGRGQPYIAHKVLARVAGFCKSRSCRGVWRHHP
eukprot:COSAG01_NODE_464_length_16617_cov_126.274428_6_plen_177_part_00